MVEHSLQGGCSCGRNQYEVVLPPPREAKTRVEVLFGETAEHRRAHASALPVLLRVPLPWIQSTTYAFYNDERPSDIRRVFTPRSAPHTKRNFCGYCGTPLTYWTEETSNEANFICINLGSLEKASLDLLDTIGVLPSADEDDEDAGVPRSPGQRTAESVVTSMGSRDVRGQPWFEELIESGALGRLKRRRGGQSTSDGRSVIEWEFVEVAEDEGTESPHKRQMTDFEANDDVSMRGN